MALISQIKSTDNATPYNVRDDVHTWGGRNLLLYTGDMPIGSNFIRNYRANVASLTDTGEGIKYDTSINNGGIEVPLHSIGCVTSGEILTCSFYARGTKANVDAVYICRKTAAGADTDNISYGNCLTLSGISSTDFKYYTFTFTANNASQPANDKYSAYFMLAWGKTNAGWLEIKKHSLKLERGNKPTDWSPAPEDIAHVNGECLELLS